MQITSEYWQYFFMVTAVVCAIRVAFLVPVIRSTYMSNDMSNVSQPAIMWTLGFLLSILFAMLCGMK